MAARYNYRQASKTIATEAENYICATNNGFVALEGKDLCFIDDETCKSLELLENNIDCSNRKHSLFGYLNSTTATTTGTRILKEAIQRPLCHLPAIEDRLECIEYLVSRVDILSNITNNIRRFGQNIDLDSMVPYLVNLVKSQAATLQMIEKKLDAITNVETIVSQISALLSSIETSDQPMLCVFRIALEDPAYNEILDGIHTVIEQDVKACRGKRGKMFRIRQGVMKLFDIARGTYSAALSDLEQYVRELNKEDSIPWRLNFGESRGYYVNVSTDQISKNLSLPPKYLRVNKSRTMISCTTLELMQLNSRASVSYENSMKLANEILSNVLNTIVGHTNALYKLVDVIGCMDLVTSFAKMISCSHGKLVKPRFTSTETIIAKGRHPVLESVLSLNAMSVVPNDTTMKVISKNFMLITGPNMGGKSIYLKQVALIQIMAQIGCYVPAEAALIKPVHRIVARCGTNDDNLSNCSSFMYEMRGIASALQEDQTMKNKSILFVIDEVGRGTSIDDGVAYSFAIAEELLFREHSFTIFATHFDLANTLGALYDNLTPYYFKYEDDTEKSISPKSLRISHRLVPGIKDRDHYGIRLAEACGLPEEIIAEAKKDLVDWVE